MTGGFPSLKLWRPRADRLLYTRAVHTNANAKSCEESRALALAEWRTLWALSFLGANPLKVDLAVKTPSGHLQIMHWRYGAELVRHPLRAARGCFCLFNVCPPRSFALNTKLLRLRPSGNNLRNVGNASCTCLPYISAAFSPPEPARIITTLLNFKIKM